MSYLTFRLFLFNLEYQINKDNILKFTEEEETELELLGLQIINPVIAVQDGRKFQIEIEKMGSNEFDINIDACVDENDYEYDSIRANVNRTETQLSFAELIDLLQDGYLE